MGTLKITVCHSDESQNLIRTMGLWEIAGQARNDDTLFLEAPLLYFKTCAKIINYLLFSIE
jgi:hypothetical protein